MTISQNNDKRMLLECILNTAHGHLHAFNTAYYKMYCKAENRDEAQVVTKKRKRNILHLSYPA